MGGTFFKFPDNIFSPVESKDIFKSVLKKIICLVSISASGNKDFQFFISNLVEIFF